MSLFLGSIISLVLIIVIFYLLFKRGTICHHEWIKLNELRIPARMKVYIDEWNGKVVPGSEHMSQEKAYLVFTCKKCGKLKEYNYTL